MSCSSIQKFFPAPYLGFGNFSLSRGRLWPYKSGDISYEKGISAILGQLHEYCAVELGNSVQVLCGQFHDAQKPNHGKLDLLWEKTFAPGALPSHVFFHEAMTVLVHTTSLNFFRLGSGERMETCDFGAPLELRCSAYVQGYLLLLFRLKETDYQLYQISADQVVSHELQSPEPLRCERVTLIQGYAMVYGSGKSGEWVYGANHQYSRIFTAERLPKLQLALELIKQTNTFLRLMQGTL